MQERQWQPVQVFGYRSGASDLRRNGRRHGSVAPAPSRWCARRNAAPSTAFRARRSRTSRRVGRPEPRRPRSRSSRRSGSLHAQGRRADDAPPDDSQGTRLLRVRPGDLERPGVHKLPSPAASRGTRRTSGRVPGGTRRPGPVRTQAFGSATTARPAPYGLNSSTNPWQCVQLSSGQVDGPGRRLVLGGDGELQQHREQHVPGDRTATSTATTTARRASPNGWLQAGGDSRNPRVVGLFIVPYQALKGAAGGSGSQVVPILGFASFYVMNWTGPSGDDDDPCPDKTLVHRQHPAAAPSRRRSPASSSRPSTSRPAPSIRPQRATRAC